MRAPCAKCGGVDGRVTERGAQDVVRCANCDKFQYNAPRTETGKAIRSVTTVHNGVKPRDRAIAIMRANCKCETCGKSAFSPSAELHVGHMVSVKCGMEMGLSDSEINDEENLIAMCSECNLGLGDEPIPVRLLFNVLVARIRFRKEREKR
jgi:hypothetical protein